LVSNSPSKVEQFSFECSALYPRNQLQHPPPALFWEVGQSSHPHSQPLCFSLSLLGASSFFGRWLVTPLPLSVFMPHPIPAGCQQLLWEVGLSLNSRSQPLLLYPCLFTESLMLRVCLFAPFLFSGAGSALHPHHAVGVRL
jgi:hypothetical protein